MIDRICVVGSSGAIGQALTKLLCKKYPDADIHTFSSSQKGSIEGARHHIIDYSNEESIENAAKNAADGDMFDLAIVATGILHDDARNISPEKSLRDLSAKNFEALFAANTIFPALAAKHFLPLMRKDRRAVLALLSARVGSISDNQIGGWYAYRASKVALNMVIKNAAIEMGRRHKDMIVMGLHPGTVDSDLSRPFQGGVKHEIFSPAQASAYLLDVIAKATPKDSGKCLAWDGEEVIS